MPMTGGGGMAGYGPGELLLGLVYWSLVLALGLIIAGIVLLWLYRRVAIADRDSAETTATRLASLESRLDLYLQATGDYQRWAQLKERERERGD